MGQDASDQEQMEQLKELIKVLLGVASVTEDVAVIVSDLFKLMHQLEVRCPQLSCHFHVSGVSQRTGDSFFVVVYDAALMASAAAKRVIKTVYTHLHSEASMVMTSALFRSTLVRSYPPATSGVPLKIVATKTDNIEPSKVALSATANQQQAVPLAADGCARPPGTDGQPQDGGADQDIVDDLLPGASQRGDPPEAGGDGDPGMDADDGLPLGTAAHPVSAAASAMTDFDGFAVAGVGCGPPDVHVPSMEAVCAVEDLFTAVRGGWVGLLRSTLTAVVLALVAFSGLSGKTALQGMLVWWPLAVDGRTASDDAALATVKRGRRGKAGDRLLPQPYPVEVQRRHNPPSERRRDIGNMEEVDYVTLTEAAPAKAHLAPISEVVATILLLFDKEKAVVAPVIDKKLAEHGVTRTEVKATPAVTEPKSITVADVLARGGFAAAASKSPPPPATPSGGSAASSQQTTGASGSLGVSTAVAARMEARRASGVASQRAAAAHQATEAAKKAQQSAARNVKRSGSSVTIPVPNKRPKIGPTMMTRSDALAAEFEVPNLEPRVDGTSCSVLTEADMLSGHTYLSLATNWPPPEMDSRMHEFVVKTATADEWDAIVESQTNVLMVMDESVVRRARKALMTRMGEVRGAVHVDGNEQPCVFVKVAAHGASPEINLTAATLQGMVDLHLACMRVQVFRAAVDWLREAAGYTSARVPDFSGAGHATNAALANEIVKVMAGCHPTDTLWRLTDSAAVGGEEGVVLPAHVFVNNCQDVCMADDIISINTIILARWCAANRPDEFKVLHCSFFVNLLAANTELLITAMAAKEHAAAGAAATLMGVCNIDNAHWVTLGVHIPSKTVWLYDSGAHFVDLKKKVQAACKQMQLFGKSLHELRKDVEPPVEADAASVTATEAQASSKQAGAEMVASKMHVTQDASAVAVSSAHKEVANVVGGGPSTQSVPTGAEAIAESAARRVTDSTSDGQQPTNGTNASPATKNVEAAAETGTDFPADSATNGADVAAVSTPGLTAQATDVAQAADLVMDADVGTAAEASKAADAGRTADPATTDIPAIPADVSLQADLPKAADTLKATVAADATDGAKHVDAARTADPAMTSDPFTPANSAMPRQAGEPAEVLNPGNANRPRSGGVPTDGSSPAPANDPADARGPEGADKRTGATSERSADVSVGGAAAGTRAKGVDGVGADKTVLALEGSSPTAAPSVPLQGGATGRAGMGTPLKKAWTTRRVKAPAQTDATSCGPFAFSFLWHRARDVVPKVLSCDAFAVRLSMLAVVVTDASVRERDEILLEETAPTTARE